MEDKNKEKDNGICIKEKVKNYLKNKKAVAMILEYILTIECFAMLFLAVTPGEVKANGATDENGITWAYTLENGQATNVYYSSGNLGETVIIPSTLDGYPVVSLHNSSWSYRNLFSYTNNGTNTTVKEVIIPSSVTSIGWYAFYNCSSLTSIEIPTSVTRIEYSAFSGCSSLESIEIPDSVTSIREQAFIQCSSLTSINIPSGVTSIERSAFYGCSSLESIEIPSGVTSIRDSAFSRCSSLTSIEIPDSVTSIGDSAFSGCSSLTSIEIPNSVTSIGGCAFSGCSSFTSIEIPNSVTSIGGSTFGNCSSLTEINIPSSVTSIGQYAFSGCSSLASIEIPSGVTSIEYETFRHCTSLTSINIPSGVTSIGSNAFRDCSSLTSIVIPRGVTSIGYGTFSGCSSLTNIEISEGVTSIGRFAFEECSSLTEIEIPASVTIIDTCAFSGCSSLTEVEIPNSVTSIGNEAFYKCGSLTAIEMPDSITAIYDKTFSGCSSLTSIEIPSSVTSIGQSAFSGCSSLTSVVIPNSVKSIGKWAFNECTSLKSIEVPSSVTTIGYGAFMYCSNLTDVYIYNKPSDVSMSNALFGETYVHYKDCKHTITRNIVESGLMIQEISNNLSNSQIVCGETYSFKVKNSQGEILINRKVKVTSQGEFTNSSQVTEIITPNEEGIYTIENINRNKTIEIGIRNGATVTVADEKGIIWNYTYQNAQATNVYYESGDLDEIVEVPSTLDGYPVVSIGNGNNNILNKYTGNTNINKVIIPEGVVSIRNNAFNGCSSLTSIEIPNSVTSIGSGAFRNCSSLTTIEIPNSITSIGSSVFSGCSSLTEMEIPSSVTSIGSYAFEGCSNLTEMEIPSSVTSIGMYAFKDCNSLPDIYIDNDWRSVSGGAMWYGNSYSHFNDCTHYVAIYNNDPREGVELQSITNNLQNGHIECGETYKFKLINEQGEIVKDKGVKITKQGEYRNSSTVIETIMPNDDGIYTIEEIKRNIEIIIGAKDGETKQVTDENGITWEYRYEDGKARALKYISGPIPETLEIPAKIDGLVVTTMADEALKGQEVTNVILPDSIINIGQSAFEGCETLETIVLPEGLQQISSAAFKGCNNLQQVELPDRLTVIGNETFSGCTNLKIELKKGLVAIGKESFKGCEGITGKLILPETLVQIGEEAFSGCTGITKLEILAYTGTEKIDESYIVASNPRPWEEGISYNLNENAVTTIDDTGIIANNEVRRVVIGEDGNPLKDQWGNDLVETLTKELKDEEGNPVKDRWGNNVVENVTIIQRNINIGKNAFSGCSSLTEVRIPAGTSQVDSSVLDGCDNLTDIYIQMKKKDMLEEIEAPEGVKVHYLDCSHEIEIEKIEEAEVEVISGANAEGKAICQQDYKFKVNIEEGSTVKGVVVKVGNKGAEKVAIKADEEGIYTIKRVTKDKEVSIIEGRIVEVRYEDKDGNQIEESTILVGEEGESYKAERKEIENYKAVGNEPANAEGIYGEEEIVVTYVYEKIPSGTITIKYEDKEGNQIIDPDTIQGYIGDSYEIARKNIKGYKAYGVTPEKAKGTYTKEDIEITFVYEEIKEGATVIKYVDEEGNYIARDKTIQEEQEVEKEELEAKEIEGYEEISREESKIKKDEIETEGEEKVTKEDGKEITYTYGESKTRGKTKKWTTEKTLLAIGGMIAGLILIFIIIATREKEVEMKGKKYKNIEDAIEDIEEDDEEIEIKLLRNIEREEKIEGLENKRITINYNGHEIKIRKEENKED